jgi:hypothetical protein
MSVGDSFDHGFPFYLLEGHQGDQPRSNHCNADFASEQLCVSSIDCNFSTWVPGSSLYFGTELQVSEQEQKCSILLFPVNGCQALCAKYIFAVQQRGSLCAHTEASCIQLRRRMAGPDSKVAIHWMIKVWWVPKIMFCMRKSRQSFECLSRILGF